MCVATGCVGFVLERPIAVESTTYVRGRKLEYVEDVAACRRVSGSDAGNGEFLCGPRDRGVFTLTLAAGVPVPVPLSWLDPRGRYRHAIRVEQGRVVGEAEIVASSIGILFGLVPIPAEWPVLLPGVWLAFRDQVYVVPWGTRDPRPAYLPPAAPDSRVEPGDEADPRAARSEARLSASWVPPRRCSEPWPRPVHVAR